jgi:ribonuclease D
MKIHLHQGDIPDNLSFGSIVAVDTETMGLKPHRDRLCLVQLSAGDGDCHLVKFDRDGYAGAKNLKKLVADPSVLKLFHFARFDVTMLYHFLGVMTNSIYCTKIASKLVRTYTDKHGLKDLSKEFLNISVSKEERTSYWGAESLTEEQQKYAATDVLYLHQFKEQLDMMLNREGRMDLAQACFDFIPYRVKLDLIAGDEFDIFHH